MVASSNKYTSSLVSNNRAIGKAQIDMTFFMEVSSKHVCSINSEYSNGKGPFCKFLYSWKQNLTTQVKNP